LLGAGLLPLVVAVAEARRITRERAENSTRTRAV
jgi:hypothetical protein